MNRCKEKTYYYRKAKKKEKGQKIKGANYVESRKVE